MSADANVGGDLVRGVPVGNTDQSGFASLFSR